jgi:hypothetical protein
MTTASAGWAVKLAANSPTAANSRPDSHRPSAAARKSPDRRRADQRPAQQQGQYAECEQQDRQRQELAEQELRERQRHRGQHRIGAVAALLAQRTRGQQRGGEQQQHRGRAEDIVRQFQVESGGALRGLEAGEAVEHPQHDPGQHHLHGREQQPSQRGPESGG